MSVRAVLAVLACATLVGCEDPKAGVVPHEGKDGASVAPWDGGIGRVLAFTGPAAYAVAGATSVALMDLDGDGARDLVLGNMPSGVDVLRNQGDGTFGRATGFRSTAPVLAVTAADVDGDGHTDVVGVTPVRGRGVEVRLNDGRGALEDGIGYDIVGVGRGIAVADLDGSGRPDIVVTTGLEITVLLNQGDGRFGPGSLLAPAGGAEGVALGDLDQDGRPDMVVANGFGQTVTLFFSTGDGSFGTPVLHQTGRSPVLVALGDADGDGWLDIFTSSRDATVSVSLNKRDRSFAPALETNVSAVRTAMVLADFDGDGKGDAAFGSNRAGVVGRVSVFPGRGDGRFDPSLGYLGIANGLAAADVDGDGRPDLVAATRSGALVLLNRSH